MSSQIFRGWSDHFCKLSYQRSHIIIGNQAYVWGDVYQKASQIVLKVESNQFYVVDPDLSIQSVISLLAIAMTPRANFIWAKPASLDFNLKEIYPGIHQIMDCPVISNPGDRPLYGTLTSGSQAFAKIPIGYADQLSIIGMYYDSVLYSKDTTIACCLPLEYSAAFMMALLPAWISAKNLIIFSPNDWTPVLKIARDEKVTVVTSPNMLATAYAAVPTEFSAKDLRFLTTAGYLSKERVKQTRDKFPTARFQVSYGSTETGIITLGEFQDNHSVGKPLWGKPVWLREPDTNNIGMITTVGMDCREFYLQSGKGIRNTDGTISNIDFGHFDHSGNLYLDGRVDSSLKVNGQLFYPRALEQHILSLENILDVKVNIVKKEIGSEFIEVTAVGDISDSMLRAHCEKLEQPIFPYVYKIHDLNTVSYSDRGKLK